MRLIDADALKKELCKEYCHFSERTRDNFPMFKLLREAPTIDAVEVVRCKYCEFFAKSNSIMGKCTLRLDTMFLNDFCSYGAEKVRR